ncbi:MAG: hypothetical protein AAF570_03970, partial [Bacteroidota bacterium]
MKRILRIIALLILLPVVSQAQADPANAAIPDTVIVPQDSSLEIEYVVTDKVIPGYLDVNLKLFVGDSIPDPELLADSLEILELYGGMATGQKLPVQKIVTERHDLVTMIVDVSSSMWRRVDGVEVHMDSAKQIVDSLIGGMESTYSLSLYTYDEQLYAKTVDGPAAMRDVRKPSEARYTHLCEAVREAIGTMSDGKGKKVLIVVGDGENDINPRKRDQVQPCPDLLKMISELDSSYMIYPVAIGSKIYEQNLVQLVRSTKNTDDEVLLRQFDDDLFGLMGDMDAWPATHRIMVKSELHPHAGETRRLAVRFLSQKDTTEYRLGGLFNPNNEQSTDQLNSLIGGLLIFLIFIIFAFLVPRQQWRDFKKKYVKQYWEVKQEGQRKYDPLTKFPFRDEDWVVIRCEHMTSMETWQYEGRRGGKDTDNRKRKNRCIYYPNKCDAGLGPGGSSDFFQQVGVFKYLFWVFMGALGGFVGWIFWMVFETSNKLGWHAMLNKMALWPSLQSEFGPESTSVPLADNVRIVKEGWLGSFADQIVLGGFVAGLITLLLAIANEMSQARGSFTGLLLVRGISRSIVRGLVAAICGAAVMFGFGYLQGFHFTGNAYLIGLLALLLMGVLIGRILTVRSGIRHSRGFFGGLMAGFVAFHIYYLPMIITGARGYEAPKMIAFIVFGGILGYILSRGAPALEASEMEVWTGRKQYGKSHITGLLRKNEVVTIGRGPTATVRMKIRYTHALNARENVTQVFATLTLRNEVVYIEPEIFTEVNGEPLAPNERRPLFDGDRISFVHKSPSHLRYREGRAGPHPRRRQQRRLQRRAARQRARQMRENANRRNQ